MTPHQKIEPIDCGISKDFKKIIEYRGKVMENACKMLQIPKEYFGQGVSNFNSTPTPYKTTKL